MRSYDDYLRAGSQKIPGMMGSQYAQPMMQQMPNMYQQFLPQTFAPNMGGRMLDGPPQRMPRTKFGAMPRANPPRIPNSPYQRFLPPPRPTPPPLPPRYAY